MSRSTLVDAVIADLCGGMGLPSPGLDGDGQLTLSFGELPVTLTYETDPVEILWINADLGEIPGEGIAGPKFLMHLAFECWIKNRMTVGLGPDGQRVWGYSCIPAGQLTKDLLEQTLTGLLEAALPIRERIAGGDFYIPDETGHQAGMNSGLTRV